ncbi:muconolactone Delta-isomerase [Planomonospora venezuelensis]|nr:muconolactone Delta-isomerase [Planomonospora venezuelensis]
MLFLAQMEVVIPHDIDETRLAELKAAEFQRAQEIQRSGRWPHLWRVAGRYANVSVFEVDSVDELHDLLSSLPMFAFMDITVTPLATHPSSIPTNEMELS